MQFKPGIRRATGISIPFPEDSKSLMDSVLQAVISDSQAAAQRRNARQLTFDFEKNYAVKEKELVATKAIEEAARRETASRTIFAQHAIRADEIEQDLKQADEAIGNPQAVEAFVTEALLNVLGVQISGNRKENSYTLYTANLPPALKSTLPAAQQLKVSFLSPTPEGYTYLGRNHVFVDQLCRLLMANALSGHAPKGPARSAVIRCREVKIKTTILLFRVRNVIEEKQGRNQFVAEEMLLWGYRGSPSDNDILDAAEIKALMADALPSANLTDQTRAGFLESELENVAELGKVLDAIALQRAESLIDAHERFRKVLGGKRFKVVEPVLPMDLMGIYILLPDRDNQK